VNLGCAAKPVVHDSSSDRHANKTSRATKRWRQLDRDGKDQDSTGLSQTARSRFFEMMR